MSIVYIFVQLAILLVVIELGIFMLPNTVNTLKEIKWGSRESKPVPDYILEWLTEHRFTEVLITHSDFPPDIDKRIYLLKMIIDQGTSIETSKQIALSLEDCTDEQKYIFDTLDQMYQDLKDEQSVFESHI